MVIRFQLQMCPRADRRVQMGWKWNEGTTTWSRARACGQKFGKVDVFEDYDSRPRQPVRFEDGCKKEPQEVRISQVPKPLPGVSGRKAPSVEGRAQRARNVMSKQEMQRRGKKDAKLGRRSKSGHGRDPRTHESNCQGWDPSTRVRKSHFDEEDVQENEEDFFNILEEERQRWCKKTHNWKEVVQGVDGVEGGSPRRGASPCTARNVCITL